MYSVINHVVNLYGLKAISIHSCCTFNMSMGVMCVLQSWVLPMYCINIYIYRVYVDSHSLGQLALASKRTASLYKHQLGIYMYKSTKCLLPDGMSSMLIPIHNVHDHRYISETKMDITSSRLELTAGNVQYITMDQNNLEYTTPTVKRGCFRKSI